MLYALAGMIVLASIGLASFALIRKAELSEQITALQQVVEEEEADRLAVIDKLKRDFLVRLENKQKEIAHLVGEHAREVDGFRSRLVHLEQRNQSTVQDLSKRHAGAIATLESAHSCKIDLLNSELAKLAQFQHVPEVLRRASSLQIEIAAKLNQAQEQADEAVFIAHKDAERIKTRIAAKLAEAEQRAVDILHVAYQDAAKLRQQIITEFNSDMSEAKETLRLARIQADYLVAAAQEESRQIASRARKEAKEKTQKVEETLALATNMAAQTREKAEVRAREIAGQAYEALRRYEFFDSAAKAKQNMIEGYNDTYIVPASHMIDELAEEYGYQKAGQRLKLARDRTKIMEKGRQAATCNYADGWKRDYAVSFVLSAFNGKVDSILARLKPVNQGKLIQEIKDAFALTNHNGEVFKNARIHEEFLDARLEELKWAVAVQRIKEKDREEQRAIREQIRDEEKAKKEHDRLVRQTEREQEAVAKAIERTRMAYEAANAEDRANLEAKLRELAGKLSEAEEKNRRVTSMAQQTKCGHVYIISNVGSFGEDVYKIGLTRRLDPLDRVKELGDASVPFAFDVHAMIRSEDAPALELALHKRFLRDQVNKVNRRKEFFRLKLHDLRSVVDEIASDVKWTMTADARDYRDSLAMQHQLQEDPEFRRKWTESEIAHEERHIFDDDEVEETEDEVEAVPTEKTV